MCNELPKLQNQDGGTWRRIEVVNFISKFSDNPKPTEENPNQFVADIDLSNKLDNWKLMFMLTLLSKYRDYTNMGTSPPEEVKDGTKQYKQDSDIITNWFNSDIEECDLVDGVAPTSIGFGSSFRYKDFNASFLIEGKSGGQIYSGTNAFLIRNGHHKKTVPAGGREAGFVPTGVMEDGSTVTTSIPAAQQEDYYRRTYSIAEEAIFDSDYMRLRQLSIGYNIPSDKLDGTFIDKATISLIGRNLFFLSNSVDNIDPESAYNNSNSAGLEWFGLPVPRTIGLNVNLKF